MRQDQIVRIGHKVHRPIGPWTPQVHLFLQYLRKKGFLQTPEVFGFDKKGREVLSFLEGEVYNDPLAEVVRSTEVLVSTAQLLRNYHDATQGFLQEKTFNKKGWQFDAREPMEVICHADFAPYNIVLKEDKAVGIIDFDTSHPGSRLWDISYALYRWAPLMNPGNPDRWGALDDQIKRAKLFCDAYGLAKDQRQSLGEMIVKRLEVLVDFMITQAQQGHEGYQSNLEAGHHFLYLADLEYIKDHKLEITRRFI
jgi:thiamine kinase-like enzyme